VASTLDELSTLPHRIHWQAEPSVSADGVLEVDFLIDNQKAWVEQQAPYYFADDGGYLVTTFLTPGEHTFTTRVTTLDGQSADSVVKASVAAAPSPPNDVSEASWTRVMTPADQKKATSSEPPPTGSWSLTIDPVGWMVHDPDGGALLFDVVYQAGGKVELRTAIEQPPYPSPTGGAFCEAPDPSVSWIYAIGGSGKTLTLHPVSHDPCGDRLAILEGEWTVKNG